MSWIADLRARFPPANHFLAAGQAPAPRPLDYYAALRVIRDELAAPAAGGGASGWREPVIVSEGANTMDMARMVLLHQARLSFFLCELPFLRSTS